MQAEWDKAAALRELDITATDLSSEVIQNILTRYFASTAVPNPSSSSAADAAAAPSSLTLRAPSLSWLSAGQLDGMNDEVLILLFLLLIINSLCFL